MIFRYFNSYLANGRVTQLSTTRLAFLTCTDNVASCSHILTHTHTPTNIRIPSAVLLLLTFIGKALEKRKSNKLNWFVRSYFAPAALSAPPSPAKQHPAALLPPRPLSTPCSHPLEHCVAFCAFK